MTRTSNYRAGSPARYLLVFIALGALCGTASASTLTVAGVDNIYGAGFGSTPGGAGSLPIAISLAGGDQILTFGITGGTNVCGSTWCVSFDNGGNFNDADGIGSASDMSNNALNSLSGISAAHAGFLTGVFESGTPSGSAPASLDFTAVGSTGFSSLSPLLDQTFFIGDGLTGDGSGSVQNFIVPTGATTLYLGFADACGHHGDATGCYADNVGSFEVAYSEIAGAPEPGTPGLLALAAAGLALLRRRAASR
ncbi:MAG TPA: PEP-CTERM sorting domain-containing protein [Bryobacteraceae bacterium]|nr:PEP-CTERM sorting domain-containing protein [Bryobacteraceae bacterium]